MSKRFWLICSVVAGGLLILSILGLSLLGRYEKGLEAQRRQDFMTVAEQIRLDVKRKLDDFFLMEQSRPYTDYQYTYVPESTNQAAALVRSPLADLFTNGLANGYFQLDSDGQISTPYSAAGQENHNPALAGYLQSVRTYLLPSLQKGESLQNHRVEVAAASASRQTPAKQTTSKAAPDRRGVYPVSSFDKERSNTQVLSQSRAAYELNYENSSRMQRQRMGQMPAESDTLQEQNTVRPQQPVQFEQTVMSPEQTQTVQVRIEPFVPIKVSGPDGQLSTLKAQVFMTRHIQVEGRHWVQGFRLNESELLTQVRESAGRLLRRGMDCEISGEERSDAVHTAILDFGFGELVLNLRELRPDWIQTQVFRMQNWFWGILAVVWGAVAASMAALWKNMRQQLQLSRQKDDFISSVSHELRTPLASIRMYTEMLEKDWVKTDAKRREYYTTMRQESERLTRLIENVLDFSRIQRGRKQYNFALGDINEPIAKVAEMMRPGIERAGFTLILDSSQIPPFMFDRDAVTQIVINLLDNAVKYARTAEDKRIFLRTRRIRDKVVIEVEDRGPGVPRSRHKKIFDTFYRCEEESTRQTTGTGLGLALVKGFAEAHNGSVEVTAAKPFGALFRITLAAS